MFDSMDTKTLINYRFNLSQFGDPELVKACDSELDRRLTK